MKKIKCIKCNLRFNDRKDPKDEGLVHKELCFNCRFIWQMIGVSLQALNHNSFLKRPLNRDVAIRLEDVHIRKSIKK